MNREIMKADYTEADYKRLHQAYVEDIIDDLLEQWHTSKNPLRARVCRVLATQLEGLRHEYSHNINVWVSAANEEANHRNMNANKQA